MRGTEDTSIDALRAYARDIEATVDAAAPVRASIAHQNEALSPQARNGTAPLLPLVVVSVVLVGAVGLTAGLAAVRSGEIEPISPEGPSGTASAIIAVPQRTTHNAQKAVLLLASHGLGDTAASIEELITSGMADDPQVAAAIEALHTVVEARSSMPTGMLAFDPAVVAAVELLEAATRPPGLDVDRPPPGQGGVPPGQDETFTPPGQDETFTPPGQDETFTPPGRESEPPGRGKGSSGRGEDQ